MSKATEESNHSIESVVIRPFVDYYSDEDGESPEHQVDNEAKLEEPVRYRVDNADERGEPVMKPVDPEEATPPIQFNLERSLSDHIHEDYTSSNQTQTSTSCTGCIPGGQCVIM